MSSSSTRRLVATLAARARGVSSSSAAGAGAGARPGEPMPSLLAAAGPKGVIDVSVLCV
jgi:hypothetical protein